MSSHGRSFSIDCAPTKSPNLNLKPRAKSLVSASITTHGEQGGSCSSTPTKINERRSSIQQNIEMIFGTVAVLPSNSTGNSLKAKRENLLKAHSDESTTISSISPSSPWLRGSGSMRKFSRKGSIGCLGGQICNLLNLPQMVSKWNIKKWIFFFVFNINFWQSMWATFQF